nr:RNA binding motif single stranded interacting [Hymenolepis microstoma]
MGDSRTSLYFSSLKSQDDEETLKKLLPTGIEPLSVKFLKNKYGQCTGCAIVNFKTAEETSRACKCFQKLGLAVKYAKESKKDSTNVYVTNIPKANFDEGKLRFIFEPYGEIVSVKLFKDVHALNTGIGFVRFTTKECANYAISHVNSSGIRPNNCSEPLFCKLADLKGKKVEKTKVFQSSPRCLLQLQPPKPSVIMVQTNFCVQPLMPRAANSVLTQYRTAMITVPQTSAIYYESERTTCQHKLRVYSECSRYTIRNLDMPLVNIREP